MAAAIPLIIQAAPALIGAAQQQQQASAEESQASIQADQIDLQVLQREGDRKKRLASALSAQNALAGASGIKAFEGSPLTVLQDSIENERVATERDQFSSELQSLSVRESGRLRKQFANQSTALNLLQSLRSTAGSFNTGGG